MQSVLSQSVFREYWDQVRIRDVDIDAVLREDLGLLTDATMVAESRLEIRRALLDNGVPSGARNERDWMVAEAQALRRYRSDPDPLLRRRLLETTRD